MLTTIVAYLLIAFFMVMERRLRQGRAAASMEAGQEDRNSTRQVGAAFGVTFILLILAPLLNLVPIASLADQPRWGVIGVLVMLAGLGLRYWASRTLGAFYTRTLRVSAEQRVVDQGPYHLIRHPGYLADLGLFTGAGLAGLNWLVTLVIFAVVLRAYLYRIRAEESMLAARFGEGYTQYQRRTWRLIPYVY